MRTVFAVAVALLVVAPVAVASGRQTPAAEKLADGLWYGKIAGVNLARRTIMFAPACTNAKSGPWIALPLSSHISAKVTLLRGTHFEIYFRPGGNSARGHSQTADLAHFADVALHGHLPDFPPGWFITARNGAAVLVQEDSGIESSGKADRRMFGCISSRSTKAFVSR